MERIKEFSASKPTLSGEEKRNRRKLIEELHHQQETNEMLLKTCDEASMKLVVLQQYIKAMKVMKSEDELTNKNPNEPASQEASNTAASNESGAAVSSTGLDLNISGASVRKWLQDL